MNLEDVYGIRVPRRSVAAVVAAVIGAAGLVGYGALGHPGLYGDQLFVVLRAQAVSRSSDIHSVWPSDISIAPRSCQWPLTFTLM